MFYRDVCLFKAQLSSVWHILQWHICHLSTLCRGLLFSHPWDRVKVQSESWRNILDSEKSGLGWHTGEEEDGWLPVPLARNVDECIRYIGIAVTSHPAGLWLGRGAEPDPGGARPTVFLLLSFRDSRRKRLSRPKVVLVLLMLLLLRTLSSMASAPSARSPVRKD